MKTFTLIDDFTIEKAVQFIDTIQDKAADDDDIVIYLCSQGGDYMVAQMLSDYFKNRKGTVTLKALEGIASSALILFLFSHTRKEIAEGTTGCFHLLTYDMDYRDSISGNGGFEVIKANTDLMNSKLIKRIELICDNEEILNKIKSGQDAYLYYEEFKVLAKRAEDLIFKDKE